MAETKKEQIYRETLNEIKKVCDTQDVIDKYALRFFITKKLMDIEAVENNSPLEDAVKEFVEDYPTKETVTGVSVLASKFQRKFRKILNL